MAERFLGLRPALWVLAALALGACSGPPKGVLLPVAASDPSASRVEMLVATTRKASPDPGEVYTGERGEVSFASITVSIPPNREVGTVQWPKQVPGNPATDFVSLRNEALDGTQVRQRFARAVAKAPKRNVLLFVHGFNNNFSDAVFRFAQIVHDSGAEVAPVLFTWPSRGSVLAYGFDRESTNYSRNALEAVLRGIATDPNVGEVTVLCHSMGNWLVLESLRQMAIRDGKVSPKIKDVILAAPDVDIDLAREAFRDMGKVRPRLTLFTSKDDNALAFSRVVWGDSVRLGAVDPDAEPYRTQLAADGIAVVNLTRFKSADAMNHAKFASTPQVVDLIGRRLAEGQVITDSRVGLGDRIVQTAVGAASTAATGAALVVSAPVALVDGQSRESYGDHVRSLGDGLAGTASSTVDLATAPGRALLGNGR